MNSTNSTKIDIPGNDSYIDNSVLGQSLPLTALFILLYIIVFFTGIGGNSLVIYVVLRNKAMQSIMNMFITNLAFSDIMLCLLAVPFTPMSYLMDTWVFGKVLCHILPMMLSVLVYVSILTCTALAVVRYFAIVYPLKSRMKTHVCLLIIGYIWVISLSLSLPLGIKQHILVVENDTWCQEKWPDQFSRQSFTITSLILQYVVPCSIITYCYSKISLELQRRSTSHILNKCVSNERAKVERGRNRRINIMLIAVVTIFVACWLPLNLVILLIEFYPEFAVSKYRSLVYFIAHVIAMSSAIYNPFLYAWKCEKFKKEFKLIVPCLFRQ